MEYELMKKTLDELKAIAGRHEAALVAVSGGKDSLICIDLACKHFKRVVLFHMFIIPGLRCIQEKLDFIKERWGLECLHYPHPLMFRAFNDCIYSKKSIYRQDGVLKNIGLKDIYKAVMHETGIRLILNGSKETDSLWRRQKYFKFYTMDEVIYPLIKWRKVDVLMYLRKNKIPLPSSSGAQSTGVDLSTPSILWLHDNYPDDFERMEEYFPFIGAVVKRRDWYGIK